MPVRLSRSNVRERSFLDLQRCFRSIYINQPLSVARGLGLVGGRVRNEICSMSTNGLSSDHVQAFSLLSSLRLRRKRFRPILSILHRFPSTLLPLLSVSLAARLFSLFLHSFLPPLSFRSDEIKRIDRACTGKEARRTGKTLPLGRAYDLFRREAPTRNIRYP